MIYDPHYIQECSKVLVELLCFLSTFPDRGCTVPTKLHIVFHNKKHVMPVGDQASALKLSS